MVGFVKGDRLIDSILEFHCPSEEVHKRIILLLAC